MNLQGRNLSTNLTGGDVALLHTELAQLGYTTIPAPEVRGQLFGPGTLQAVQDFQRKRGLTVTGVVDPPVAKAINAAVDAIVPASFTVSGLVRHQDGMALGGVIVRAFDKDLRSEQPLGQATSNVDGRYEIVYSADKFARGEKKTADLIVRAFSPEGLQLSESSILFNAPAAATVNLTITPLPPVTSSEYEQLVADITPALDGVAIADLTDGDIAFLAAETGEPADSVTSLRLAAQLLRQTATPAEAFYGWFREGLPPSLDGLLALDPQALRTALEKAISGAIIPAVLGRSLAATMQRVDQLKRELTARNQVQHQVLGQLLSQQTGAPLEGFRVQGFDLEAATSPQDIGYDVTDRSGGFMLTYTTTSAAAPAPAPPANPQRRLRLQITSAAGAAIPTLDIQAISDGGQVNQVRVSVPPLPVTPSPTLADLDKTLDLKLPAPLLTFLASQNVHSLADINAAGGIGRLPGLPVPANDAAVQTLEAHASLSQLSPDPRVNAALITRGYASPAAISGAGRSDFVSAAHDQLGDVSAARMFIEARVHARVLDNVATHRRAGKSNGFDASQTISIPGFDAQFPASCGCEDCHAAVSPLAYLADLINYALAHAQNNGTAIDLQFLADTFHQPFGDLPTSCELMDKKVHQVRICVEVLRRYLSAKSLSAPSAAEQGYRLQAYIALLNEIGTSYDEIRLARTADPQARQALADRLGILLAAGKPDHLDALFLDPSASPVAIPEATLEQLFGLIDTSKSNPLAPVPDAQIVTWRWDYLRSVWRQQDHPIDRYSEGFVPANDRLPVIDPDVIGPDDFRSPVAKSNPSDPDQVFDLWLRRRQWVDDRLQALSKITKTVKQQAVPDLDAILAAMRTPVLYGKMDIAPWFPGTQLADFDLLSENLAAGVDVDATKARIEADLKLSLESLTRLMAIRRKQRLADIDPNNEKVSDEEWGELFSILTQAQKERLFPNWIGEEQAWGHVFGPTEFFGQREFWAAQREPKTGDWPPATVSGVPLIDPEIVGVDGLPDPVVGERARQLWDARQSRLAQIRSDLQTAREQGGANGFDAMVRHALGDPHIGDPLPNNLDLDTLEQNLASSDPAVVATAQSHIGGDLHMTIDAFTQLMGLKAEQDPSPEDWNAVYAILASAQKAKREYPGWLSEESTPSTGVVYWTALKATLPPWRATPAARQAWRNALELRGQPPLIDPDLIGLADLNTASAGPGPGLWTARRIDIQNQMNALSSQPKTADGLHQMIQSAVGASPDELKSLDQQRATDADVAPRLDQLDLPSDAFSRLVSILKLAEQTPPAVVSSDWDDAINILTQVQKCRSFAKWRHEEESGDVILDPDQFQIAQGSPVLPTWRANATDRANFQDALQSRIDEQQAVKQALADSVSAVEENNLPVLRDVLIMAANVKGATLDSKADAVTDALQIDAKMGGCDKTTRVAQAIETLQDLIFSARTGQLEAYPSLTLYADEFDAEWKWMGSYATWRAAMLVFIYPENNLDPSLRKWQTPPFAALVSDLRQNRFLDPAAACKAAHDYASYYYDVCNLEVETSCRAKTRVKNADCQGGKFEDAGYLPLFYIFARSKITNKVYYSTTAAVDAGAAESAPANNGYTQSFWTVIPAFDQVDVKKLIGAVPYEPSEAERFIYLFALVEGNKKIVFLKFDLEQPEWNDALGELTLPDHTQVDTVQYELDIYHVIAVQRSAGEAGRMDRPPAFFLDSSNPPFFAPDPTSPGNLVPRRRLYLRVLTADGNGWEVAPPPSTTGGTSPSTVEWDAFRFWRADVSVDPLSLSGALEVAVTSPGKAAPYFAWRLCFHDDQSPNTTTVVGIVEQDQQAPISIWSVPGEFIGVTLSAHDPGSVVVFTDWGPQIVDALLGVSVTPAGPPIPQLSSVIADYGSLASAPVVTKQGQQPTQQGMRQLVGKLDYSEPPPEKKTGAYLLSFHTTAALAQSGPETWTPESWSEDLTKRARLAPKVEDDPQTPSFLFDIVEELSGGQLQIKRKAIETWYVENAPGGINPGSNLTYLAEAYYFVPMQLALELQRTGQYLEALDWLRSVFDYSAPKASAKIYYGLTAEDFLSTAYQRAAHWLLDPLNPHSIAATRQDAYTRYTIMAIVRCLLAYADSEFTFDTSESLPRARTLYLTALRLLGLPVLKQQLSGCTDLIGTLDIGLTEPQKFDISLIKAPLADIFDFAVLDKTVGDVKMALSGSGSWDARVIQAGNIVALAVAGLPPRPTMKSLVEETAGARARAHAALFVQGDIALAVNSAKAMAANDFLSALSGVSGLGRDELENGKVDLPWLRLPIVFESPEIGGSPNTTLTPRSKNEGSWQSLQQFPGITHPDYFASPTSYSFCIPPNPNLKGLRQHAEVNLFKLRNCRNIAGMIREVAAYVAPTDPATIGQPIAAQPISLPPTRYRYSVILERAKSLAALAQQVEASYLSMLEKSDAESYSLLKARQDLGLAQGGVRLQALRVQQAQDGVGLAELQQGRAQFQADHYQELLDEGNSTLESAALVQLVASMFAPDSVGAGPGGPQITVSPSGKLQTQANIFSTLASYERRAQEWQFQKSLAGQDILIGGQNIAIAEDQVWVANQEAAIAQTQADNAQATVDFLSNKFTSVELYDWMSGVLQSVYSFFLQQATATAQVAAAQLAFERQEIVPQFIQTDYWQAPSDDTATSTAQGAGQDRRGLTGSARLLADIYQLDQYAFDTNARKLQLTKTISLAQMAPAELQRFQETGMLPFATPMELFDRDFPGHILRLIHRVRGSVIALIPPAQGIRATLSTAGTSRVVVPGDTFQTIDINRGPEQVALSTPINASGLFDVDPQSDMLNPFEGIGVDTQWELRMPKAANLFDYSTIADVQITIDYTALNSFDYQQQVLQSMRPTLSSDRAFSFRNQFPDQWYDLHNPDQTTTPLTVTFTTLPDDFPSNLDDLKIQQLVLYFSRADGQSFEVPVSHLYYQDEDMSGSIGGGATSVGGVISTRKGNGGSWMPMIGRSPFGDWELAFPDTQEMRNHFSNEDIQDILFVITYSGRTPSWPM
jgi:hypothetical protein